MKLGLSIVSLAFSVLSVSAQKPEVDILHYHHQLSLVEGQDSIKGLSVVSYAGNPEELVLNLKGRDTSSSGMTVVSVTNGLGNPLKFAHRGDSLYIATGQASRSQGKVRVAYYGRPADGLIIGENKFGDPTWFGDNWPNRAQHWIPVVDHPSEKAKVDFSVQVPLNYKVVANGILKDIDTTGQSAVWSYSCQHEIPTKVMVIGVANFSVKHYSDSSITPVSAWVYPQNDKNGFYDYGLAPTILSFYDSLFGDYPYDKLANVQSTTRYGGMENASCIFYSETSIDGHRSSEALIAHEIVHQWFGNTASECDWPHIWLSEGFATYFTEVYFEMTQGEKKFQERWASVRSRVMKFYAARPEGKIIDEYSNLNWHLSPLTYQRAAMVLHILRMYIGDGAFFEGIQSYYAQYEYSNACTKDFVEVMQQHSEKDIGAFLMPWLENPIIPELKISTKVKGKSVKISIETKEELLKTAVLPVYIQYESGKREKRIVEVKEEGQLVKLEFNQKVSSIGVDPYGESLVILRK